MKTHFFNTKSIFIAGSIATLLSACGGQAYRPSTAANDLTNAVPTQPGAILPAQPGQVNQSTPSGRNTIYNPQTGQYQEQQDDSGIYPVSSESFEVTGPSGRVPMYTSPNAVVTDNLLRVKITAGIPPNTVDGSNVQLPVTYDCVKFKVTVAGQSQEAYVSVSNGAAYGPCQGQAGSQAILDFSSRLTPGHTGYQVSVQAMAYDNNCQTVLNGYQYQAFSITDVMNYCSTATGFHQVESIHKVSGQLEIQTNGSKNL